MAVQPIDALVRLQVGLVQDTPDGRAADRFVRSLVEDRRRDVAERPAGCRAAVFRRLAGRNRDDVNLRGGGKRGAVAPSVVHLANRAVPVRGTGLAIGRPCVENSPTRPRSASSAAGRALRPAGQSVPGRPTTAAWTQLVRSSPTAHAVHRPTQPHWQKGGAWRASLLQGA